MSGRITLRDVAEEAGVSVSTVSLVVNKKATKSKIRISDETVRLVEEVAVKLNYVPNLSARAMSQGRTMVIGLVMYEIRESAAQLTMIEGISSVLKEAHYALATGMTTGGDADLEAEEIRTMLEKGFDRIIFEASEALLTRFRDDPTVVRSPDRFILLNRTSVGGIPSIKVDEEKAAYLATRHLIDLGHHNIAFMGSNPLDGRSDELVISNLTSRFRGYVRAAEETGIEVRALHDEEGIEEMITGGLTGVYCSRSFGAIDLLGSCYDRGIRIPEDLSIVGHEDSREKRVSRPRISTIYLGSREVGERAALMALASISGERPKNHLVEPQLIVRESSAPPRQ